MSSDGARSGAKPGAHNRHRLVGDGQATVGIAAFTSLVDTWDATPRRRRPALVWAERRAILDILEKIRAIPRIRFSLTDSPQARQIRASLAERHHKYLRNGLAAGVLVLPMDCPESYVKGRARQALRTNSARAVAAGITCREIDGGSIPAAFASVLSGRADAQEFERWAIVQKTIDHNGTVWIADDADGSAIALLIVFRAENVAYLACMISADTTDRSAARYLLSGHAFVEMARQGVSHVINESMLQTSAGSMYFTRRLGFDPMHVSVTVGTGTGTGTGTRARLVALFAKRGPRAGRRILRPPTLDDRLPRTRSSTRPN